MKKKLEIIILIILGLVILDQLSKYFFYDLKVFTGHFFFYPLFNTGISRGIPIPQPLIMLISFLCVIFFVYLYYKKYLTFWEISLFIAGTIGNLLDRCFLGGVRDFISLGNFPVFNLADVFLTSAVIILCIREFLHLQSKKKTLNC
ncbi:MAG: signal peptidase II [Candidatus Peribacteria bacterium]|jgi:signal peptidase II|nr:signal peptidase II [Candidatus Peribacteria bacterium]